MNLRDKFSRFLYILLLSLFSAFQLATASAQPNITAVNGAIQDGGQITITGSGFGTGPNLVLFDDFESGSVGAPIKTGPGSATVGTWSALGTTHPEYSNLHSISGTKAFRADMQPHWMAWTEALLPDNTTEVFLSWWMLIPPGDKIPGIDSTDCINWKVVWLQGSGTTDDDYTLPVILGPGASPACQGSLGYAIAANGSPYTKYLSLNFAVGKWKRVWMRIKGGAENTGAMKFWELDDSSGVLVRVNDTNVTTMYTGSNRKYERVHINGYGRSTAGSHPTFDDVYIASGSHAQARVELGNNAVYTQCTKLAIFTPTSWNSSTISATVRQGVFGTADPVFLFVFNAAGEVSGGFPLTFGGTPSAAPAAPENLMVQ